MEQLSNASVGQRAPLTAEMMERWGGNEEMAERSKSGRQSGVASRSPIVISSRPIQSKISTPGSSHTASLPRT